MALHCHTYTHKAVKLELHSKLQQVRTVVVPFEKTHKSNLVLPIRYIVHIGKTKMPIHSMSQLLLQQYQGKKTQFKPVRNIF